MTTEVINQILNVASVVILAWLGYRYKLQSDKQALDAAAAAVAQKEATDAAKAAAVAAVAAEKSSEEAKAKAVEATEKAAVTSGEVTEIHKAVNSERTELLRKLDKAQADHKSDIASLVEKIMELTSQKAVLEEKVRPTESPPATEAAEPDGGAKP